MKQQVAYLKPAAVFVTAAGVVAAVATFDPNVPGHFPTCPSFGLGGIYCPGCGSLRALHALTRFDFGLAWSLNPALLLVIPYFCWAWVFWLLRSLGKAERKRLAPAWILWSVLGVILLYWVLRNIPALAPWLAPNGEIAPAFRTESVE
ncbi:MAG: DUF2752 domain-containing protein [Propionibacteriaceae bacterium]|nr:DUF2752 domain-containing protein [Propionibacteriaceae bacterium]